MENNNNKKTYYVAVSFWEPQAGILRIEAESVEQAEEMVRVQLKDVGGLKIYETTETFVPPADMVEPDPTLN